MGKIWSILIRAKYKNPYHKEIFCYRGNFKVNVLKLLLLPSSFDEYDNMPSEKIVRKIAVIFVADAVGFSKMMAKNEDLTLKSLRLCREILDNLFAEHGGRIFNTAGDSVLAEFQSAVSAVICATEFQKLIKERNKSVEADAQMRFRVGLNMGDVIVEGSNLYGDGVNVAARLEALCQPEGVSLSKSIHDFVSQKVDFTFADLGDQKVKNTVVHAFDIAMEGVENRTVENVAEHTNEAESSPPTIAVLPFKNMSNDEEQEYFADGVTEDIIGNLSSWKSFPVISRSSSFSFKNMDLKYSDIAEQLGADYIVEGSIRKGGNKVRITASLVDAKDSQQVWSKRWDRSLEDIFEVQDEVSQEVAALITPALKMKEQERVQTKPRTSFSAWDSYLKALSTYNQNRNQDFSEETSDLIMQLCDEAIEKDPQLCDAYVLKCRVIYGRVFTPAYSAERQENEALFHKLAEKSYDLDRNNPEAVIAYSRSFNLKKDYVQRVKYAKEALDLNPSHAETNFDYGLAIINENRQEEAEALIKRAIELNPVERSGYEGFFPLLYMSMRNSEEAMKWCNILSDRNPHSRHDGFRASISAHLGNLSEAAAFLESFRKARPEIKNLEDYRKVAPKICEDYLFEGFAMIWDK